MIRVLAHQGDSSTSQDSLKDGTDLSITSRLNPGKTSLRYDAAILIRSTAAPPFFPGKFKFCFTANRLDYLSSERSCSAPCFLANGSMEYGRQPVPRRSSNSQPRFTSFHTTPFPINPRSTKLPLLLPTHHYPRSHSRTFTSNHLGYSRDHLDPHLTSLTS